VRASICILAVLSLAGCQSTTHSSIGDPIEMGPYVFSVVSATQGRQWESAEGTYREVVVRIRVHRDDTAPFTDNFTSSFIDSMTLIDAAGNSIGATPAPVSPVHAGGRARSGYYTCLFRFSRSSEGVRDFDRIGTRPRDFRLLIANPAREGRQPSRVSIQLG
jgi:hypothetical protein